MLAKGAVGMTWKRAAILFAFVIAAQAGSCFYHQSVAPDHAFFESNSTSNERWHVQVEAFRRQENESATQVSAGIRIVAWDLHLLRAHQPGSAATEELIGNLPAYQRNNPPIELIFRSSASARSSTLTWRNQDQLLITLPPDKQPRLLDLAHGTLCPLPG